MGILYMGKDEPICADELFQAEAFPVEGLPAADTLAAGQKFYYISQDNYCFSTFESIKSTTLYCDSATSCIVIIVTGKDASNQDCVMMSHLSRLGRFEAFFQRVKDCFSGEISIFAVGANPPEPCKKTDGTFDYTARNNAKQVMGLMCNSFFKQCDLTTPTKFLMPVMERDIESGIRYAAMKRRKPDGTTPAWAGVNEYGVSFVAADSYMDNNQSYMVNDGDFDGITVFDMYLQTISKCKTAEAAAKMACDFYNGLFKEPDIFMVGDASYSYFIEAYNGKVICIKRENGCFASTNHFRMVYGGVPFNRNHSTYLRLNRAEQILQTKPDLEGIGDVLRDGYFGKTVWSVCRYADNGRATEEELYYTQAAVIFNVSKKRDVVCEFVINGNASTPDVGYIWRPFIGQQPQKVDYIGKLSNLSDSDLWAGECA